MTEPARPPAPDHAAFHRSVADELAAAPSRPDWPMEELDRIDGAVRRRTRRSAASNLASHLRALEDAADIDVAPPTASSRAAGRGVKVAISRATGWYVGHIAAQLRHLGVATSRAMKATATRVEELDQRLTALEHPEGEDRA